VDSDPRHWSNFLCCEGTDSKREEVRHYWETCYYTALYFFLLIPSSSISSNSRTLILLLYSNYQSISIATVLLNHRWKGVLTVPPYHHRAPAFHFPFAAQSTGRWASIACAAGLQSEPYPYHAVADHTTTPNTRGRSHTHNTHGNGTVHTQAQTVGAVCPCAPKACQCHHSRQAAGHIRHALTNLRLHKQDQQICT
jgi:hypothetical protein